MRKNKSKLKKRKNPDILKFDKNFKTKKALLESGFFTTLDNEVFTFDDGKNFLQIDFSGTKAQIRFSGEEKFLKDVLNIFFIK